MILFADTSALVKLYVQEAYSDAMQALVGEARMLAVSRIAWAETMAAFARRVREQPADAVAIEGLRMRLRADWPAYAVIEVTQPLVELAGDYADTFALRAYDSVQLASARILQEGSSEVFQFACFDARLQKAAKVLGMGTPDNR
ncbi:type II toxin-antitoxin system VapC family toxin [Ottowia pentelensis]|uniref:Type II toxin-antitoxin system VapC family toxin n=1 Tax=Ottowia pentelensis TaxID=511108 RepID=A0ABV6PUA5_9BURK